MTKSLKTLKKQWMQNSSVKAEYKRLTPEFAIAWTEKRKKVINLCRFKTTYDKLAAFLEN